MNRMLEVDNRWQELVARDKRADGAFVYGVRTTRVFCRPSCSSRLPRRENVEFFSIPALAEAAGYRACKRCHPTQAAIADSRLALVQNVCDYIQQHIEDAESLTLACLGVQFHHAPQYIQEVFAAVLAMTPRQYAEVHRMDNLKTKLREAGNVSRAIYDAGFGSSSRVYERSDAGIGMTPVQYINHGNGVAITYTVVDCYLGALLVGVTGRGICAVGIYDDALQAEDALRGEYARAEFQRDDEHLKQWVVAILEHLDGSRPVIDVPLDIQATAFQWKVWNALRQIPRGETRTYSEIAAEIGQPKAVRAVASACANNHAAIVIPCHRVIGKNGQLSGYKWGIERKRLLLDTESHERAPTPSAPTPS
jgi:AraC family transcriptional regulator, regulatory protein of adaptative response / methylated-DNA-[protein]-cysteine methyltransferase